MSDQEKLFRQHEIIRVFDERVRIAIEHLQTNRSLYALQTLEQIFPELEKIVNQRSRQ